MSTRAPILTIEDPNGINRADLLSVVPAAGAKKAHYTRSENYGFVSSEELLDAFEDIGFYPTYAVSGRTTREDRRGNITHIIRLRFKDYLGLTCDVPDVVFKNDSAGGGAYWLIYGYVCYICENMLIFGDYRTMLRIPHRKNAVQQVVEGTLKLARMSHQMNQEVEVLKQIQLDEEERQLYARYAFMARRGWLQDEIEGEQHPTLSLPESIDRPEHLLIPRRPQDENDYSLWKTYNIAEENARGGLEFEDAGGKTRKTRRISSPSGTANMETFLYSLTQEFKKLKLGEA